VENYKKVDELFGKAILHRRDKKVTPMQEKFI